MAKTGAKEAAEEGAEAAARAAGGGKMPNSRPGPAIGQGGAKSGAMPFMVPIERLGAVMENISARMNQNRLATAGVGGLDHGPVRMHSHIPEDTPDRLRQKQDLKDGSYSGRKAKSEPDQKPLHEEPRNPVTPPPNKPDKTPEKEKNPDPNQGFTAEEHRVYRESMDGSDHHYEWTTTRVLDLVKDKDLLKRAITYKSKLANKAIKSKAANFGYCEVDDLNIDLNKNNYYAHSKVVWDNGSDTIPDISPEPGMDYKRKTTKPPKFPYVYAPNNAGIMISRAPDTEYKILNDLAENIDEAMNKKGIENRNDLEGKITLFTEKDTCGGCNYTISLFKKRYPGITVEVIHNKGVQIPTLKKE